MMPGASFSVGEPKRDPPLPAQLTHLKPSNVAGALYVVWTAGLTCSAIALSLVEHWASWLAGQALLAIALLQWFVLLHEAGHNTLFRTGGLNRLVGQVAGFFALIPFSCWKAVHNLHHRWTGWQDLDLTTATLVPRPLSRLERFVLNFCWRMWLPLFSTLYRINNFWNVPRLWRRFPFRRQRWRLMSGIVISLALHASLIALVGSVELLRLVGLGLLLSLILEDPLILSQHTHIPQEVSGGAPVRPYTAREQEVFTRSLAVPSWFARLILLNFDAHELHHMYPWVPGYALHRIDYEPENRIHWLRWLLQAKRLGADVFLFQNRRQSGVHI